MKGHRNPPSWVSHTNYMGLSPILLVPGCLFILIPQTFFFWGGGHLSLMGVHSSKCSLFLQQESKHGTLCQLTENYETLLIVSICDALGLVPSCASTSNLPLSYDTVWGQNWENRWKLNSEKVEGLLIRNDLGLEKWSLHVINRT